MRSSIWYIDPFIIWGSSLDFYIPSYFYFHFLLDYWNPFLPATFLKFYLEKNKLRKIVKDRNPGIHGITKSQTRLSNWTTVNRYLHVEKALILSFIFWIEFEESNEINVMYCFQDSRWTLDVLYWTLLTGKVVKILELVVKQFQQLGTSTDTLAFIDTYSFSSPSACNYFDRYMIRD